MHVIPMNPFFCSYEYIPFHLIKIEHYEPAILQGIQEECAEIDKIVSNPGVPTFENTIVSLEQSGALLERVTTVMYNQLSAHTSDDLEELADDIITNEGSEFVSGLEIEDEEVADNAFNLTIYNKKRQKILSLDSFAF